MCIRMSLKTDTTAHCALPSHTLTHRFFLASFLRSNEIGSQTDLNGFDLSQAEPSLYPLYSELPNIKSIQKCSAEIASTAAWKKYSQTDQEHVQRTSERKQLARDLPLVFSSSADARL